MSDNPYAPPTQDPILASSGPAAPGTPQHWDIGTALSAGLEGLKRNPMELILGFLVTSILGGLPQGIPAILQSVGVLRPESAAWYGSMGVGYLLGLIATSFFLVGQLRVALAVVRGEPVEFATFFSGGDRMVSMLGVVFLAYLAFMLGLVLLIVPGIIVGLGFSMAALLVVDADMGVTEALSESWRVTQGHKMALFGFMIVATLLVVAGLCACYVGVFVATPVLAVAFAEIYRCITGRMQHSAEGLLTPPAP